MRIAFANAAYRAKASDGGNAHVAQFVTNAAALGHEIWMWPRRNHPSARALPEGRLSRFRMLTRMDVIYSRVDAQVPLGARSSCQRLAELVGGAARVWEFNTIPQFAALRGASAQQIGGEIRDFNRFAARCDLAVCVSKRLAQFVEDQLGIKTVVTIPNGSDPELFRPDVPKVPRFALERDYVNVVWMGSAKLQWHNLSLLRDAAKILWEDPSTQHIRFSILGEGRGFMKDMPKNVGYYGPEEYSALPNWLSAMHIGLCLYTPGPADYGSPLKLFDYMSSGLAVIGTPQPQLCEVFAQLGQADLVVPADDPKSFAKTLASLAIDRDRVRRQGQLGRQLVLEYYNWRRVAQETLSAISAVAQKRS